MGEIVKNGIEPTLSGLTVQVGQEVDNHLVDEVRNFLFGAPGSPGFDLASLNIQRGRDHGLASYNDVRRNLGLKPATNFADVSSVPATQANLSSVYASVADIDLWVGGLAENHVPGAMVGETVFTILRDQFERTRDGDRFWYQSYLPPEWVALVEQQTLSTIIKRNAVTTSWKITGNAFLAASQPVVTIPPAPKPTATPPKPPGGGKGNKPSHSKHPKKPRR